MSSVRTRVVTMVGVSLAALGLIGGDLVYSAASDARDAARAARLAELSVTMSGYIHESQKERGRTAGLYGNDTAANRSALYTQRTLADGQRAALDEAFASFDPTEFGARFQTYYAEAARRFGEVRAHRDRIDRDELGVAQALGAYTALHGDMIAVIYSLSDYGSSTELIDAGNAYVGLLKLKERAGIERAVLNNTFAQDAYGPGMLERHAGLVATQGAFEEEFRRFATDEMIGALDAAQAKDAYREVQRFREIAHDPEAIENGFGVDAGAWFGQITAYIDDLKAIEDRLSAELIATASADTRGASIHAWVVVAVSGVVAVALVVMGGLFVRSILGPLGRLRSSLDEIANGEGDLTRRLDDSGTDDFARVASSFNAFVASIEGVVRRVSDSSAVLADNAASIARTSAEMADGVGRQSSMTEQVSAAIEEMSASVREVAQNSAECAQTARESRADAESGGRVVGQTAEEMRGIADEVAGSARAVGSLGERSQEIGQIIAVINEIADQTNLLALNAAIEAARAGEHGRGFAVVADEVRKLAERTTVATEQVRESIGMIQTETESAVRLIESGTERVSRGVGLAEEAGEAMGRSVDGARMLLDRVDAIAAAADEQSTVSTDIASSVETIQSIGQESNAQAAENADVARSLADQAEELRALVNGFRVG